MTPYRTQHLGMYEQLDYVSGVLKNTSYGTSISDRHYLTCGPMIQGDRVHPNSWSWSRYSADDPKGYYRLKDGIYTTVRTGSIAVENNADYASNYASYPDAAAYNSALSDIYDTVRGGVDLAIDLAEIKQTTQMISHSCKTLLGYVASVKRGLRGTSRSLSDAWLQWQYGIKPMVGTIYELSSRQLDFATGDIIIKKRRTRVCDVNITTTKHTSSGNTSYVDVSMSTRCEIKLKLGIDSPSIYSLSQFTSLNPISVAWELVPYSFVVDWFVDVGGYLRMAETALMSGLTFRDGYKSFMRQGLMKRHTLGSKKLSGRVYTYDTKCSHLERKFNRTTLHSMPLPMLPPLDIHLGSQRLLSAAALLRGFMR